MNQVSARYWSECQVLKPWNDMSRLSKTGTTKAIATVIVMKSRRGQDDSPRRISRNVRAT